MERLHVSVLPKCTMWVDPQTHFPVNVDVALYRGQTNPLHGRKQKTNKVSGALLGRGKGFVVVT